MTWKRTWTQGEPVKQRKRHVYTEKHEDQDSELTK